MPTLATIPDGSLHIRARSPLDLSSLRTTAVPAGARGRIQAHATLPDKLVEARNPSAQVRFHVASWALNSGDALPPTDHAAIAAGVRHLAASGYNAIRIFGVEHYVCDYTTGALNFPSDRLDVVDYIMYCCKMAGIYWVLCPKQPELYQDGLGASRYSMPGSALPLKGRLFTQAETRAHWLAGFTALWNRTNPYTGLNILADPALALIECMNENSAMFWATKGAGVWPAEWQARDGGTTQGTAGQLWPNWLAAKYADVAALNAAWGTAYANIATAAAASRSPKTVSALADIDAIEYIQYLDDNMWDWYGSTLDGLGYAGLRAPIIVFPNPGHATRLISRKASSKTVHNSHTYVNTNEVVPADGSTLTLNLAITGCWQYTYAIYNGAAYGCGSPRWLGEYGWVTHQRHRYMYPMMHAFTALHGGVACTHFHQGNFFTATYQASNERRTRELYPYHGHCDPVSGFGQVVGFFALHKGYCSEGTVDTPIAINDYDLGLVTLRSTFRARQNYSDFYTAISRVPALGKTSYQWSSDASVEHLSGWYSRSFHDWCVLLQASGAITDDNESLVFAAANHGSILGVDLTDVSHPVLKVASHTLKAGCLIAIMNLNGTSGTWPGNSLRYGGCEIEVVDATHLRIVSSTIPLAADLWTGSMASGDWCEIANHTQSGNKELRLSRIGKYVSIDTPKLKFYSVTSGFAIPAFGGFSVSAITDDCALFVAAWDDLPIATGNTLIVGLCGNEQNTGDVLSADLKTLVKSGTYPVQAEQVAATFRLTVARPAEYRIRPLGLDGREGPAGGVTVIDAGTIEVSIATGDGPVLYWELSRMRRDAVAAF